MFSVTKPSKIKQGLHSVIMQHKHDSGQDNVTKIYLRYWEAAASRRRSHKTNTTKDKSGAALQRQAAEKVEGKALKS